MKMGVEVGWLLQQHEIEGMKLIAGEKGLQKVMEKVNLLDNPVSYTYDPVDQGWRIPDHGRIYPE